MTKVVDFRDKSDDQLGDQLASLKKEQFNLRFQRASGQLENTSRFREVRHDIARILTVLQQRGVTPAAPSSVQAKSKKTQTPAKRAGGKKR